MSLVYLCLLLLPAASCIAYWMHLRRVTARLRSERESGLACRNVTPSGRPACMALPLDGCPCNEPARNAGEVGR
jgi:hypothetical protein